MQPPVEASTQAEPELERAEPTANKRPYRAPSVCWEQPFVALAASSLCGPGDEGGDYCPPG